MMVKGNKLSRRDIRNILLIQLGDIGDVVLSFPCIRALKENFPDANIIIAVREKAKELIEDCQWASGVISINQDKRSWVREIAYQADFFIKLMKYNFDLAIDMRTGTRGAILAFLSGARQRIGFYDQDGNTWRSRAFTHMAKIVAKSPQHVAEFYLNHLAPYNIKTDHIRPEHDVPAQKKKRVDELFKKEKIKTDRPVIAIHPFSLWRYKEWGANKYTQLIKWVSSEYGFPVIITGSLDEKDRAHNIVKTCKHDVYNFTGATTIGMFAAVINACQLFVGGDSAGLHIAAAVGTPTVGIFGPSSFEGWAPRGENHMLVHKDFSCVPCDRKGCDSSGVSRCLEELTLNEVMDVVKVQIARISDEF